MGTKVLVGYFDWTDFLQNESEVFSLGRLETMLQDLEKDKEKHSEIERVTELLKVRSYTYIHYAWIST